MNKEESFLWEKIKKFELDDPKDSLTFSKRLARENRWTLDYTLKAIEEYKKFIFLICVSNQSLTPSDQVDQVWHLHLIYTYSYWVEFCGETLGRQIHHGPTKGGNLEREKYSKLYRNTLELYELNFKMKPPSEFWPDPTVRFAQINFSRVNMHAHWLISKPGFFVK